MCKYFLNIGKIRKTDISQWHDSGYPIGHLNRKRKIRVQYYRHPEASIYLQLQCFQTGNLQELLWQNFKHHRSCQIRLSAKLPHWFHVLLIPERFLHKYIQRAAS